MREQKSLNDVHNVIDQAEQMLREIMLRGDAPELSFEQRIISAVRAFENGDPLKDYLDADDIEQAIRVLADVYTVTGVRMPEDWR